MFPLSLVNNENRRISSKRQCELLVGKWFIFMVCVWGVCFGGDIYAGYCFTLFDEYIYNINGLYIQ